MMKIFVVIDCKARKPIFVTHSACKARKIYDKGMKVEIWANDALIDVIRFTQVEKFKPYIQQEKEFIGMKQKKAEERNRNKRNIFR